MNVDSISTVIAGLSSIGALGAAFAAWYTARTARDAVRMQIMLDFSKRDAQTEMGACIELLWNFTRESKADVGERFAALEQTGPARYKELDEARRIVHKYYLQMMQVKQAGLISDKEILIAVYRPQLETVVEVLQPIERKKPAWRQTKPVFDEYNRLYKNYDALYKKVFRKAVHTE